jgi:M6 family metalloprotease-like protein
MKAGAAFAALLGVIAVTAAPQRDVSPLVPPIDPQRWQDQQDMTWSDYRPIPGVNWADPSRKGSERNFRVALIAVDFPDQPFVITQPKQSDPFGNPQVDPVRREEVPRFYADFWGQPNAFNHGHTIHEYWMEQSRGRVGIPAIDAYGPYRMPRNLFEYGLNEWGQRGGCPSGYACESRMEPDVDALWAAAAGPDIKKQYDIVLRIYAGYDETTVWQEFGEMKFVSREDIPAEWGNPDKTKPRWVATRYVPWTSWKAGAQQWGLSSVRQGESSGTITHEIAHFAFRTGDNNNNPYAEPYRRVGSGPWDIMDRGSFNGPGGPHRRWVVPPNEGASMPAGFMLRNRIRFEFVRPEQVLRLNRNGLAQSGLALATIAARAVDPGPGAVAGITVALDGDAPQDRTPPCDMNADPLCPGEPVWNFYSVEVVQRIGNDSFTPDNGVLIAKNKDGEGRTCGYNCFTWVIDSHPEDIDRLDFAKPDGLRVMRTVADYRQLNDALFHAGLSSGSQYEWVDEPNRLHFYVVDMNTDERGILSYRAAVRSLDGGGPHARGVFASAPGSLEVGESGARLAVMIRNTGKASAVPAALHPQDATAHLGGDVYRLSLAIDGDGWEAGVANALVALRPGETATMPVHVRRTAAGPRAGRVSLIVTSESDPTKSARTATTVTSR